MANIVFPVHRAARDASAARDAALRLSETRCPASSQELVRDSPSVTVEMALRDAQQVHQAQLPQDAQRKAVFRREPQAVAELAAVQMVQLAYWSGDLSAQEAE